MPGGGAGGGGAGSVARLRALRRAPGALSAEQCAAFDRDGFLLPLRGVSPGEAARIRQRIEDAERAATRGGMTLFYNAHLRHRWWLDLCTSPAILGPVRDLLGPDVLIWKSQLWIKEPGPAFVGWHQDSSYWGLEPHDSVNVWMAITDVTENHGPLELLRGSHLEQLRTLDTYTVDNILTRGQDIDWGAAGGPDRARVVPAVLRPGELSIHHLGTAHGSRPNLGPGRRIGFNVTFVAPHVASVRADGASALLVAGEDRGGRWRHEHPPGAGADAEEAWRRKNEGQSRSLMAGADMPRFAEVSRARASRNLPAHAAGGGGEGAFAAALSAATKGAAAAPRL